MAYVDLFCSVGLLMERFSGTEHGKSEIQGSRSMVYDLNLAISKGFDIEVLPFACGGRISW